MSDQGAEEQAAIDPVQAARARLAEQGAGGGDALAGLRRQVRGLWIMSGVTLALLVALAAFSLLPRLFGVRMFGGPDFQGRPGQFQMQQGGQVVPGGQDTSGQQTTP